MQQVKISLPDDLRERLDAASKKAGHSLGEEIRRRLGESFEHESFDAPTRDLADAVKNFSTLVKLQTSQNWHSHPAANRVMRHALTARLKRLQPPGDEVFKPGELPKSPLVPSADLDAMGQGLEAINFYTVPVSDKRIRELMAETKRELLKRQKSTSNGERS